MGVSLGVFQGLQPFFFSKIRVVNGQFGRRRLHFFIIHGSLKKSQIAVFGFWMSRVVQQGKRTLSKQHFREILDVPRGLEAFDFEAVATAGFLSQEAQR